MLIYDILWNTYETPTHITFLMTSISPFFLYIWYNVMNMICFLKWKLSYIDKITPKLVNFLKKFNNKQSFSAIIRKTPKYRHVSLFQEKKTAKEFILYTFIDFSSSRCYWLFYIPYYIQVKCQKLIFTKSNHWTISRTITWNLS